MTIKPLHNDDWDVFSAWAKGEGWQISLQEQRLFQNQWRPCFSVLWKQGKRCAFISAVIYANSAWIGNLIVHPQLRQQGYGSTLFKAALDQLSRQEKIKRIWLTASQQGAPLYRRNGFVKIDQIERWQSRGQGGCSLTQPVRIDELAAFDRQCWGESRRTLLAMVADDGRLVKREDTLAVLQPGIDFWLLGPWLQRRSSSVQGRWVIARALTTVPQGKLIVTDILASSGTSLMLKQAGFELCGENQLMCRSNVPVAVDGVVSLASLGSIG